MSIDQNHFELSENQILEELGLADPYQVKDDFNVTLELALGIQINILSFINSLHVFKINTRMFVDSFLEDDKKFIINYNPRGKNPIEVMCLINSEVILRTWAEVGSESIINIAGYTPQVAFPSIYQRVMYQPSFAIHPNNKVFLGRNILSTNLLPNYFSSKSRNLDGSYSLLEGAISEGNLKASTSVKVAISTNNRYVVSMRSAWLDEIQRKIIFEPPEGFYTDEIPIIQGKFRKYSDLIMFIGDPENKYLFDDLSPWFYHPSEVSYRPFGLIRYPVTNSFIQNV